jgi:hypothetical protein
MDGVKILNKLNLCKPIVLEVVVLQDLNDFSLIVHFIIFRNINFLC